METASQRSDSFFRCSCREKIYVGDLCLLMNQLNEIGENPDVFNFILWLRNLKN